MDTHLNLVVDMLYDGEQANSSAVTSINAIITFLSRGTSHIYIFGVIFHYL